MSLGRTWCDLFVVQQQVLAPVAVLHGDFIRTQAKVDAGELSFAHAVSQRTLNRG